MFACKIALFVPTSCFQGVSKINFTGNFGILLCNHHAVVVIAQLWSYSSVLWPTQWVCLISYSIQTLCKSQQTITPWRDTELCGPALGKEGGDHSFSHMVHTFNKRRATLRHFIASGCKVENNFSCTPWGRWNQKSWVLNKTVWVVHAFWFVIY